MIGTLRYRTCADHHPRRHSLECEECADAIRVGRSALREIADVDAYTDPALNAVLFAIGWTTERSTIEGRRRVFDEWGVLVNVYNEFEAWEEIRARGLENGRKS